MLSAVERAAAPADRRTLASCLDQPAPAAVVVRGPILVTACAHLPCLHICNPGGPECGPQAPHPRRLGRVHGGGGPHRPVGERPLQLSRICFHCATVGGPTSLCLRWAADRSVPNGGSNPAVSAREASVALADTIPVRVPLRAEVPRPPHQAIQRQRGAGGRN